MCHGIYSGCGLGGQKYAGCGNDSGFREWTPIPVSSGEFKEKNVAGELTEQELKAVVTDTGALFSNSLRDLLCREGLVRLKFTNGTERVVGTDQFPVVVTLQESGSPAAFTLSFKRSSPEPAKILKSF